MPTGGNFPRVRCNDCHDIIGSSYPGEWVSCSCFKESHGALNEAVIAALAEDPTLDQGTLQAELLAGMNLSGIYIDSTKAYTRLGGNSAYTFLEDEEGYAC